MIRFATNAECANWDALIVSNPDGGNVFQSAEMAKIKRQNGWATVFVVTDSLFLTIIEKKLPFLGKFWYVPKGPGVETASELLTILPQLKEFAAKNGVFAIKIEPEIRDSSEAKATLAEAGLVPSRAIQPNSSTVIIDLAPPLEEIMKSLNQKGRNAIRRAERDGVTARAVELNEENMRTMFDLLAQTAAGRFDASLRSFDYYKNFWQKFAVDGRGSLFFAYFEGKVVASAYCMYLGEKGLYKDGASLREKVTYGASHLLQWEIIKWMKQNGVKSYDLCGAPHSSQAHDQTNSFYGIGKFKRSFNKQITDYVGGYDLVVKPRPYRIWRKIGERAVISLSWRLKRRQWY